MLHGFGAGSLTNRTERVVARVAIQAAGTHLDQFMCLERAVYLRDHFFRESLGADLNNRGAQGSGAVNEVLVSQEELDEIAEISRSVYGFDPGRSEPVP